MYIYLFSFRLSSLEPFYGNGALFPINTRNHCRMNTTWNKLIANFFIHPFSSLAYNDTLRIIRIKREI